MIRTILKSENKNLTLQLPDDLVGKMIEVIAFAIEGSNISNGAETLAETNKINFKNAIRKFTFNSNGYKFDRDNANDYE